MKHYLTALGALALTTGLAQAGGIDRSGQSILTIFEKGNYAELSFGMVTPSVSGTAVPILGGFTSDNMARPYTQTSLSVKTQVNENLDIGLVLDQPFGADSDYPVGTNYYAQGMTAQLEASALTALAKYRLPNNISIIAGLRYQTMKAEAFIPISPHIGYSVTSDTAGGLGYVVGIAYEKPEIALRIALTYNSEIDHNFTTSEDRVFLLDGSLQAHFDSVTPVTTPESVNLEFQSGVAKDTLVFGSVRWVDWSNFQLDPPNYPARPLLSYASDTVTYSLGVGHRFTENWAAALTVGYEAGSGGYASDLGPTDGKKSISLGGIYTKDNMKISAGVTYVAIGDAQTDLPSVIPAANFTGNSAIGIGVKVGFTF
jgi:long-subunit fatty acid transport protein